MLDELLPVATAQPIGPLQEGSGGASDPGPRTITLHVKMPASAPGRAWIVELEVNMPLIDPERVLRECEGFLVDGADGCVIGVVDRVELAEDSETVSGLLVSSGWFGRHRFRVDPKAIRGVVPAQRRVIVDESQVVRLSSDRRSS